MDLCDVLKQFDLDKYEAQIYLQLLKLGPSNAGPVISACSLHRQFVYGALEKLEKRALVTHVIRNGRKLFSAAHPSCLLKIHHQKTQLLEELVPNLLQLQGGSAERLEVKVLYGRDEFFENLKTLIEVARSDDHVMRIIGGAGDEVFYRTLGRRYETYRDLLRKAKVEKHLIAPEYASSEFKQKFAHEPGNILKTMSAGLSSPTYTRITRDLITIEIYATEVMIIQIYNRAVARGYREHFDFLWAQAKRYAPTDRAH